MVDLHEMFVVLEFCFQIFLKAVIFLNFLGYPHHFNDIILRPFLVSLNY